MDDESPTRSNIRHQLLGSPPGKGQMRSGEERASAWIALQQEALEEITHQDDLKNPRPEALAWTVPASTEPLDTTNTVGLSNRTLWCIVFVTTIALVGPSIAWLASGGGFSSDTAMVILNEAVFWSSIVLYAGWLFAAILLVRRGSSKPHARALLYCLVILISCIFISISPWGIITIFLLAFGGIASLVTFGIPLLAGVIYMALRNK